MLRFFGSPTFMRRRVRPTGASRLPWMLLPLGACFLGTDLDWQEVTSATLGVSVPAQASADAPLIASVAYALNDSCYRLREVRQQRVGDRVEIRAITEYPLNADYGCRQIYGVDTIDVTVAGPFGDSLIVVPGPDGTGSSVVRFD